MGSYFLLLFIVLILSLLAGRRKSSATDILVVITALFFIFWGLREGFTLDYEAYASDFSGTRITERHEGESLYAAMTGFFSYRAALLLQTALFCVMMYICFRFYINQKYWWLGFAVLFLNIDFLIGFFSGYRSSFVTMAIFVALLLKLKIPNQWLGMLAGVAIIYVSSLIHYSGIFMIPIVLISIKPTDEKVIRILRVLSIIAIVVFLFSASVLNNYLTAYAELYAEDALVYMEGRDVSNYYFSPANMVALIAKLYMFFYTLARLKERVASYGNVFVGITAIFFFMLLMPPIGLLARFFYYMLFPALIGITTMMVNERNAQKRLLFLGSLAIYLFLKYHVFVSAGYTQMMNYSNIMF